MKFSLFPKIEYNLEIPLSKKNMSKQVERFLDIADAKEYEVPKGPFQVYTYEGHVFDGEFKICRYSIEQGSFFIPMRKFFVSEMNGIIEEIDENTCKVKITMKQQTHTKFIISIFWFLLLPFTYITGRDVSIDNLAITLIFLGLLSLHTFIIWANQKLFHYNSRIDRRLIEKLFLQY